MKVLPVLEERVVDLPSTIKGHHLPPLVSPLTREEWKKILLHDGYIDSESDKLLDLYYTTLQNLKNSPSHILTVISGDPDFICQECPKQVICYDYQKYPELKDEMRRLDNIFLQKVGLTAGERYSVREIIERVNPNTYGWLEETKAKLI
ncbi:MAG TPA: DUF1284 domain-containing protein [Candidatus Nanoarchaeia archaeon]|nr:DUF1284 domain-containing protein [Candidatus Nanoarchaeia archaeon]